MMTVASVMSRHPDSVSPALPLVRLEERFQATRYTGFPVVDEGRLVGVVSRADVVRSLLMERSRAEQVSHFYSPMGTASEDESERSLEAIAAQVGVRLAGLSVGDVMAHTVITIEADRSLRELARLMLDGEIHRLPVVDGDHLIGLVTSMDLVRAIADGRIQEAGEPADPSHRPNLGPGDRIGG